VRGQGTAFTPPELDSAEQLTANLRSWHSRNGTLARTAVVAQLNTHTRRLRLAPQGTPETLRAFRIGAELADIAASMTWDVGLHSTAQRYFILSAQLAHAAGDDILASVALASLARQCYDLGRPDDGLEIVQLAQYGTRRTATPTLQALLLTREAWAYAQMGQVREFERVVGLAQDSFAQRRAEAEPWWLHSFDEAEMEGVIGARTRDLAGHDPRQAISAEQHIRRALDLRDPSRVRNRTFDVIGLARTKMVAGEPDEACDLIQEVLPTAERLSSGRVVRKLQDFAKESERHRDLPGVQETRDAIRAMRTA
jgi:hypothetical protein